MAEIENKTGGWVYCDFNPNHANDPLLSPGLRERLVSQYESDVDVIIQRIGQLPALMVHNVGDYVELLVEARKIYTQGHFYSCVAMCGIVAERITKDILKHVTCIRVTSEQAMSPSQKAFDQLERVDVSSLVRFLKESGVFNAETSKAADALLQLRNTYAHARGKSPQEDALKAIEQLHRFVDNTMSVLKDNEIRDGKLVPKNANS